MRHIVKKTSLCETGVSFSMVIYTVFVYNDTKNNITVKCRIFQGVTFYLTTQKGVFYGK